MIRIFIGAKGFREVLPKLLCSSSAPHPGLPPDNDYIHLFYFKILHSLVLIRISEIFQPIVQFCTWLRSQDMLDFVIFKAASRILSAPKSSPMEIISSMFSFSS